VSESRQHSAGLAVEAPVIVTPRLDLVSMSAEFMRLSLCGRRADAARELGAALPETWPGEMRRFVEIRLADLEANPAARPWLLRAIVLREPARQLVGAIGFHDPPGPARTVEIGYAIEEAHRRQGYAREAADALCARAATTGQIDSILASVSPDNEASLGLISRLGFRHTGRRWDDEDGWELTFERTVPCPRSTG
jgi:RimJ/RimL family protein N-acetyltransferase